MDVKNVAVIGAGIMGHGIAQVAAEAGFLVKLRDVNQQALDLAISKIRDSLARLLRKGSLSEEHAQSILEKILPTLDLQEAVHDADFIVEAVPEILEVKREVFGQMDGIAPPHTIFATNTSQFRITSIAASVKRRDRVIGTHFFNPPVIRRFVEVVRGIDTSEETLTVTLEFCRSLKMETVVCKKDSAGFITSRMISIWSAEAERIYEEGVASKEDIDKACRLAFGHPMGPFELSDFTGLDTGLRVRLALTEVYGDRFRPSQIRENLVQAGYVGRKAGRGFYQYTELSGHSDNKG